MTPEQIQALIDQAFKSGQNALAIAQALEAAGVDINLAIQSVIGYYRANNIEISGEDFDPLGTVTAKPGARDPRLVGLAGPQFFHETLDPEPPGEVEQFRRFIAGQQFGRTPALSAAAQRMFPMAQTQFGLQPNVGGGGFNQFRDFIRGGSFLRGDELEQRLGQLGGALVGPVLFPQDDPLGAALQERFATPESAFSAFAQPTLQAAGGVGRNLLANAFARFERSWLGQNPGAGPDAISRLFGYPQPPPPPDPFAYRGGI